MPGVPVEITNRSPSALKVKPYVLVWPLIGSMAEPSGLMRNPVTGILTGAGRLGPVMRPPCPPSM